MHKRKLIEVALPLERINRESAREKSIKHGHPATLHLWWARRPLAAARAVLFAQLVDDPSSDPTLTEVEQRVERERLHALIERLVVWENVQDESLLAEARAEILRSTGGNPPAVLDPFAGGGSIPLEAQRLGLEAHASDLNPVAVLINKALLELPPKFRNQAPRFPGRAEQQIRSWRGVEGLAEDVRAYSEWMRSEAHARVGHLYPNARLLDGSVANVVAWIWARTVVCPNPGCGVELPLVRSWWLSKKKARPAFMDPRVVKDPSHASGLRIEFSISSNASGPSVEGTMSGRQGGKCVNCDSAVSKDYVKAEGVAGRMGARLMAIVAEGSRQRHYLAPTPEHEAAASVSRPDDVPTQELSYDPRNLWTPQYGLVTFADLFTNRQLVIMTTMSDLIPEVHAKIVADTADFEYADAVATYLAMVISKLADRGSSIVTWVIERESTRNTFARQAIPMSWDFVEPNPFASGTGSWSGAVQWTCETIEELPSPSSSRPVVTQADASSRSFDGVVISTDPPYYDNIAYSDLSDFLYVWLRRSLAGFYPDIFRTMLVPKAEELVANPYRHGGRDGAKAFFEDGFRSVFARARRAASAEFPITVYYAFKQAETSADGSASSGWETLLEGMVRSGWAITSTWPVKSETNNRMISVGTNALASSIVLSLRPRPENAVVTDRRGFISALESELPEALRKLQQGQIAPVDLPQAAIGPGMAVFSRFGAVLEPDGSKMSVRSALARINEILDQVLNEQEGDFDATSRFAIAWYRQHGYGVGTFGDADNLARARNTSVDTMDRDEILTSRAGNVQLIKPADLSWDYDVLKDVHTSNWEALHHLIKVLEHDGIAPAGDFLRAALNRPDGAIDADLVKELSHLLFRIAEANGWTKDALRFNTLVTTWPELVEVARSVNKAAVRQDAFDFNDGGD